MLFGADPPQTLRGTGLANPEHSIFGKRLRSRPPPGAPKERRIVVGFMLPLYFSIKPSVSSVMRLAIEARLTPEQTPARPSQERDCASTGSGQTLPCSHPPSEGSQLKNKSSLLIA